MGGGSGTAWGVDWGEGISKLCYSGSLCLADGLKTPKIEIGFLIVHVILRKTIKNE